MTLRRVSALIPLVMLPLGLWLGYRAFGDHSPAEVVAAVRQIPPRNLALATLFTLASYTCLTGFDAMALHYLGRTLPYPKIALTSFVSLSIGHNVGVAALSSGTLRYRFYSEAGLSAVEVGKIILFCGVTVGLGLGTLGGLVLALRPGPAGAMIGIDPAWARAAGVGLLALAAGYVLAAARVRRPLRLRGHEIGLPRPRLAAAQIVLGTANFAFVAAVLHQLLAEAVDYGEAASIYVLGSVAALVSHVPGGLGVIEYVIALLVPGGNVVGALLGLRIIYFFVPLLFGSALLAATEILRWRTATALAYSRRGGGDPLPHAASARCGSAADGQTAGTGGKPVRTRSTPD